MHVIKSTISLTQQIYTCRQWNDHIRTRRGRRLDVLNCRVACGWHVRERSPAPRMQGKSPSAAIERRPAADGHSLAKPNPCYGAD